MRPPAALWLAIHPAGREAALTPVAMEFFSLATWQPSTSATNNPVIEALAGCRAAPLTREVEEWQETAPYLTRHRAG
jgi:hypothetical protein